MGLITAPVVLVLVTMSEAGEGEGGSDGQDEDRLGPIKTKTMGVGVGVGGGGQRLCVSFLSDPEYSGTRHPRSKVTVNSSTFLVEPPRYHVRWTCGRSCRSTICSFAALRRVLGNDSPWPAAPTAVPRTGRY